MGIDSVINKKLIAASHIFSHTMSADVSTCVNVYQLLMPKYLNLSFMKIV